VATAIRIGNPASWRGAVAARDESGGTIDVVSDEEILEAYRLLAREEGIFAEPASAACVAGLLKMACREEVRGKTVVCIITGHGLKDPETAMGIEAEITEIPAELEAVERAIGLR
jgi:threonine synthase